MIRCPCPSLNPGWNKFSFPCYLSKKLNIHAQCKHICSLRYPATGSRGIPVLPPKSKIVVVGAGAFGGWSALYLLRAGFNVTLLDAWGPGNSRSSSGDETRVIRSTYGANEFYFDLNVRALELWKENEQRFGKKLFFNTGVLWFCYNEKTAIVDASIPYTKKHKMEYEYLTPQQLQKRYPPHSCRRPSPCLFRSLRRLSGSARIMSGSK